MYKKVRKYIEEHHMLEGIDYVIAGLSGGADSVCLLFMLREYLLETETRTGTLPCRLTAVHVHHGIRGEEADADARFCRELCEKLKVEYRQYDYDVPAMAERAHLSEEEMGRKLRYDAFWAAVPQGRKAVVAVAHHQNDQAETVLFHLARGSFLKGGRGMEPVHDGVIRPLLCVNREEIENWAAHQRVEYRMDSTNFEGKYARNRMRLTVMPCFERNINSESVRNICRFAERMAELDDYLELRTAEAYASHVKERTAEAEQGLFLADSLKQEHTVIRKSVAYKALSGLFGFRDLQEKHVNYLLALYEAQTGRSISLPGGVVAKRTYNGINLGMEWNTIQEDLPEYFVTVERLGPEKEKIRKDIMNKKNADDHCTKYFDYGKIRNYIMTDQTDNVSAGQKEPEISVRHRRPGDYMIIDHAGHRKKIKELLIECKVPLEERDRLWLFAIGSNILWVAGIRGTAQFWIDEKTEEMLKLEIKREKGFY